MKYFHTVSLIVLSVCGTLHAQTNRITFQAPNVYPEGIAINSKTNKTYVSSVRTGTIGVVDSGGNYREVYKDENLKSSFGMKVDKSKGMLWVCIGDPNFSKNRSATTFKKMARIIAVDLTSGKKINDIDLSHLYSGNHFLNDLTFDNKGNLYITDSFSPVIYKIDANGKPSVWAESDKFKSKYVGLNGIAYHPDGFILVAHNTDGCIFKIDINKPENVSKVNIATFFPGADGLSLDESSNLVLVQNKGVNKIFKLSSSDHWKSAKVIAKTPSSELFQNPTTLSWNKKNLYVLNAKLNELSDSTIKPSDSFSFQQVIFQPKK